jgi:uncharacterized protein
MPDPVVHFEITGDDPPGLRAFFGGLFGWEYEATPVSRAVSDPDDYGFVDLLTGPDGSGIRGGVGGGAGYPSRAMFYVAVADVERALQRAEELGGTRRMGPETSPSGLVVGHFSDPAGNLIGVAQVA